MVDGGRQWEEGAWEGERMRGGGWRGENAYTHGQLDVHAGIPPSCNVCVFLATQQERTSHGDTEVEVTRVGRVRLMVAQPCLTSKPLLSSLCCPRRLSGEDSISGVETLEPRIQMIQI